MSCPACNLFKYFFALFFYFMLSGTAGADNAARSVEPLEYIELSQLISKKEKFPFFALDYVLPRGEIFYDVADARLARLEYEPDDDLFNDASSVDFDLFWLYSNISTVDAEICVYLDNLRESPHPFLLYTACNIMEPLLVGYQKLIHEQRLQLQANARERLNNPNLTAGYATAEDFNKIAEGYRNTEAHLAMRHQQLQERRTAVVELLSAEITQALRTTYAQTSDDQIFWSDYKRQRQLLDTYLTNTLTKIQEQPKAPLFASLFSNSIYKIATNLLLAEIFTQTAAQQFLNTENLPAPLKNQVNDLIKYLFNSYMQLSAQRFELSMDTRNQYIPEGKDAANRENYNVMEREAYRRAHVLLGQLTAHIQEKP